MTQITKLLVANRGEIARRVMRTARRMDIATVAVFSEADRDAPHVHEADEAVALRGSTPRESYLDIDAVVEAARRVGADAIHPGYGFLSENAAFARACEAAGITFVGPTPDVIEAMGSKLGAKALMEQAGVPVLPGATLDEDTDIGAAVQQVGLPVLVKASFGGGGRGMRVVRTVEEADAAVHEARREAASAFSDGTVFLERFVERPRHIEVQIFGDKHGQVTHLFERECSIQRRYQKIIEEAPSPAVSPEVRAELGDVAVRAARALNYVGAGTVEFVMDQDSRFYFLEVNTRLQVEHPVTELITGLDLVELQLRVAQGERLPAEALSPTITGHAVEARLYAEDVAAGYVPTSGLLRRFELPAGDGVRVDSGYESGSTVSTFYDAMLAKVIGYAEDREASVRLLATALDRGSVHGIPTNRDLLVRVLRHPAFAAGATDTGFLDQHADDVVAGAPEGDHLQVHALAAALALQAGRRAHASVQPAVTSGFRNVWTQPQRLVLHVAGHGRTVPVAYDIRRGIARVDDVEVTGLTVHHVAADVVDLTTGGVRRRVAVRTSGSHIDVDSSLGSSSFLLEERFTLPGSAHAAGSLVATMPGTVVSVPVEIGDVVEQGQVLVVLEAMKMEHSLRSPHRGTVTELHVKAADQVANGDLLALVTEDA